MLKKCEYFDLAELSIPYDYNQKFHANTGRTVKQLEYSKVIGSLMYAMSCTGLDISFVVGMLSRFTSNQGKEHWNAIQRLMRRCCGFMKIHEADHDSSVFYGVRFVENKLFNGRKRTLRLKHNYLSEMISQEIIVVIDVRSSENVDDPMTKGLKRELVLQTSTRMGLMSI
ncbi:uncharacterized protein LOC143853919 [Tasmannia lanceolata]|uniref:uncharacterized protein LOC143853919 n=1 Tax=Tasmannia lanceolata TaxID=3420 RepID=UPI004062DBC3